MAKKRRQKIGKKEDYDFSEPEFDKSDFVRKEIRNAKANFLAFGFAVVMALISIGFLLLLDDFRVGAVIGLFGVVGLYFVFNTAGLDMENFEKKTWAGVGAVYIFTWLMLTILISNPPILDIAEPDIDDVFVESPAVGVNATGWGPVERTTNGEYIIHINESFRIRAKIVDNGDLKTDSIKCEITSSESTQVHTANREKLGDSKYAFDYSFSGATIQTGFYEFTIFAEDSDGNSAEYSGILYLQ